MVDGSASISVIVPCYNAGRFIKRTIDSVLSQDYPNYEVVVVEDGSTDGSPKFLEHYGAAIRLLRHTNNANKGQAASLNLGIANSKSDLVAFLDSDDCWYPGKLTQQAQIFAEQPDVGLVYTNGWVIDEADETLYPILAEDFVEPPNPDGILLNCFIRTPSMVMVRRKVLMQVGQFTLDMQSMDHDMWIRFGEKTRFQFLDEKLTGYRQHSGQQSLRRRQWEDGFRILSDACRRYSYSSATRRHRRAVIYYRLGEYDVKARHYGLAVCEFFAAFLLDPKRAIRQALGISKRGGVGGMAITHTIAKVVSKLSQVVSVSLSSGRRNEQLQTRRIGPTLDCQGDNEDIVAGKYDMDSTSPRLSQTETSEAADIIWISWMTHQRNQSMAAALGIELHEYKPKAGRFIRYLKSALWTVTLLRKKSPSVVICTNPSIVLTAFLLLTQRIFALAVVIDAHFIGVQAARGMELMQPIIDWLNRRAALVIVTNAAHAERIRAIGGSPFVSPDPLPVLPDEAPLTGTEFDKAVFLICSFDVDEPYTEVFAAFEQELRHEGFKLYVSGNFMRAGIDTTQYAAVNFLGFIPKADYIGYLKQSAVIIDLTTVENCLVCGAYEALAAGKPLVLSNTTASMEYFQKAAVYTDNTAPAIARNIREAYANRHQLVERAAEWRKNNHFYMRDLLLKLKQQLSELQ